MVTRAIVLALSAGSDQLVAGLPLGARAALALHAAGTSDVTVYAPAGREAVRRVLARRGIAVREPDDPGGTAVPPGAEPVLILGGDLLVDGAPIGRDGTGATPSAVRVLAVPGLAPDDVRAVLVPADTVPPLLRALARGPGSLGAALAGIDRPREAVAPDPEALVLPLDAGHPPPVLERVLLDHQARRTARGDGYLAARVDRRLSRPLTRLLLRAPVRPAQITLTGLAIGLLGAAGLGMVSEVGRLVGILGLILSAVLDCVDGEVARARLEQSPAGARLDVVGDYLVHLATFAGLGVGLIRQGLSPAGRWAALALVLGVGAAMAVMHAAFVGPALSRGGDLHWAGAGEGRRQRPLATVAEKVASRDYTYLLLLCALAGHLEWFLYAAAVGAWAFVAGLAGYRSPWVISSSERA